MAALAVLVALGAYAWVSYRQAAQLKQTIQVVVGERLGLSHTIEQQLVVDAGTDVDALWRVGLDDPLNREELLHIAPAFAVADAADQRFFSEEFSRLFARTFDAYVLYAGEMPLGSGTICPELPCNIQLLIRPGDRELFVRVSKI